ncbi:hypothetical protein AVEN_11612-1 [Araneus ventricosus]|uniref:Uncharacterized protein n=1 Tax=Araneus ventricosus TaxID=182803 RepID=A0A4Y2PEI0_ARAVE|nr:hypothetical protein AVEN_11612-1 [Araneus ventricosus]
MEMTIVPVISQNNAHHILCTSDNVCTNRRKLLKLAALNSRVTAMCIMSVNLRPFRATLTLGNRKKSGSDRSGEYWGFESSLSPCCGRNRFTSVVLCNRAL